MQPKLRTDRQVARRYNIPLATLRTGRVRGYGPPYLKLGRTVRYQDDDVEIWLANRRVTPGSRSPQAEAAGAPA